MALLPVQSGPSAFVDRQLEALSPRDRMLLAGLLGAGSLAVVAVFFYVALTTLEAKAATVRETKERVVEMQSLQDQYAAAAATFASHEERLKTKPPVSTFIEELARKHSLADQLSNINAQGAPEAVGSLSQQRYTVEIKKAPQENIFRFLHELETSGYPASVESANFKSQAGKDGGLEMSLLLDLVVLSVAEG
jgi:hypothetical protein